MTVQTCRAERENLVKTGLSRGSHLVSCASDRGVLIDVVTCWGVSWGLRRERYFCSGWGPEAKLSSGWWQLLTAFGSSPSFSTPGKAPPSRCLYPSCFWKSRPSSPTLVPPSDSVSHGLSPGARCRLSVSMAAVCSAWAVLHCLHYYINRKQWSGYTAIHSAPPPPATPGIHVFTVCVEKKTPQSFDKSFICARWKWQQRVETGTFVHSFDDNAFFSNLNASIFLMHE